MIILKMNTGTDDKMTRGDLCHCMLRLDLGLRMKKVKVQVDWMNDEGRILAERLQPRESDFP